jgi:hypothetical protein
MRCLVACLLSVVLLIAVGGCRSCDRVQAELRARETDVRELREELDRCGVYNQTLQHEVQTLRGQLGLPADGSAPPASYPVQSLVLGRQTGGRSNDVCPGDDALQVQVEPRDPEGQAIKAPGQLVVNVHEVTSEGIKRPLSTWVIPPEQMRRSWKNGLLTTGYLLNLPWKIWPTTEKLRVTAQFQLADGRVFEADRDITVRLTPLQKRPKTIAPKEETPASPLAPPTASDPEPKAKPLPATNPAGQRSPVLLPAPRLVSPVEPEPSAKILAPVPLPSEPTLP